MARNQVGRQELTGRENYLRAAEMRGPAWIPCRVAFLRQVWRRYRERLEDVITRHPAIFGSYRKGSTDYDYLGVQYRGNLEIDEWQCVWRYIKDGMTGQIVGHPLEDWGSLKSYKPPEYPLWGPPDGGGRPIKSSWNRVEKSLQDARGRGELVVGNVPHGFMFMRLHFLRGFSNLMMDFAREDPRLTDLIDMVLERNIRLIERWLELGPLDVMRFGDDLGMQDRLPIRPEIFRKYLIPAYAEMFGKVRDAGTHVSLHSDGYFLEIMGDLIRAGVTILNPQDSIHGIEKLKATLKGEVCIDLDIDRQHLMPRGTRREILQHIERAVTELGSRKGGLMLYAGIAEDVPLRNIEGVCEAMERMMYHYS